MCLYPFSSFSSSFFCAVGTLFWNDLLLAYIFLTRESSEESVRLLSKCSNEYKKKGTLVGERYYESGKVYKIESESSRPYCALIRFEGILSPRDLNAASSHIHYLAGALRRLWCIHEHVDFPFLPSPLPPRPSHCAHLLRLCSSGDAHGGAKGV